MQEFDDIYKTVFYHFVILIIVYTFLLYFFYLIWALPEINVIDGLID